MRAVVLAAIALLALCGSASADVSTDISDAEWQSVYGVSAADVYQLAQGFPDGTFRPELTITRGQFAKMAVNAFGFLPSYYPVPLFSDVPPGHYWYPYVMGVSRNSSFMSGYPDGTFRPDAPITRGEVWALFDPWVRSPEDVALHGIQGANAIYASISSWFRQEGATMFDRFADHEAVPRKDRPITAYLAMRGVVRGSESGGGLYLRPEAVLTRAQAVALLLRARATTFGVVPTVTGVTPGEGPAEGGTAVVITGTGFTDMDRHSFGRETGVRFGDTWAASYTADSPTQITVISPPHEAGPVHVQVSNGGGGLSAMVPSDRYTYVENP